MPQPKLTFKGVTYTYDIQDGKVVNRALSRDLKSLIETELMGYGGIDEKEMAAINEMILKELETSDIPWDEIEQDSFIYAFG